ncbi:hypothetical protein PT974_02878 [Cladobotryum mycophilum]|uniref:RING-type domain-containing protein n=1 Tax=Cladobotryum mycophilum TaxID=491253 RepID=A0ABR0T0I5_9HYPO
MAHHTLLQLRAGGSGLQGPYLQENLAPYKILDQMDIQKPTVIMAVGGQVKRNFLSLFPIGYPTEKYTISLTPWPNQHRRLLLDCELHLQPDDGMSRILGGPQPGHYTYHLLKDSAHRAASIAHYIYTNILPGFCDLVLLFVPDIGGYKGAINYLLHWMQTAMAKGCSTRANVVLVFGGDDAIEEDAVRFELTSVMLCQLRKSEPQAPHTFAKIKQISHECFAISAVNLEDLHRLLCSKIAVGAAHRAKLGLDFSAVHWKALLRSAIAHHISQPSLPFNMVTAARVSYPLPTRMEDHLADFLQVCTDQPLNCTRVIASALVMDAFPPNMHAHSLPARRRVQNAVYEANTNLRTEDRPPNLTQEVEREFKLIATGNTKDSAPRHIQTLQSHKWLSTVYTSVTCSICLIRNPFFTLNCQHRLCNSCVTLHGQEFEPWRFRLPTCPLCRIRNGIVFSVKPPTAGLRVLDISGIDAKHTWQFLKHLQGLISLNSMPFREHFDSVFGTDLDGWTFADCKNHMSQLKRLKMKKDAVTFSKELHWDLQKVRHSNNLNVTIRKNKTLITNVLDIAQDHFMRRDLTIRYEKGVYTRLDLERVASKLLSCLFYIELASAPEFYTSPEVCTILVCCRVPPGHGLLDLLARLHRNKACIYYQGSESTARKALLCTDEILGACRKMHSFSRQIRLSALSLDTAISIQIDGIDGRQHNISKCPYRLGELILDQGVGEAFGNGSRKSLRPEKNKLLGSNRELGLEIDTLIETLNLVTNVIL